MEKWFTVAALLMLVVPVSLYANGDPVAHHCALILSKSPVARRIPQIQIERENLEIHLDDGFSRVSVDYVLHNMSGEQFRDIRYGFPVDWEGDGPTHWDCELYFDDFHEKGWSDDYVTDFSFRLDSRQLVASCSADTLIKPAFTSKDWHEINGYPNWKKECEEFESDKYAEMVAVYERWGPMKDPLILEYPVHRKWYYTVFTIEPYETVTLHVEYKLKHQYSFAYYYETLEFAKAFSMEDGKDEWFEARNHFIYDFSPAAAWGDGTATDMNIIVHYPDSTSVRNYSNFDYASAEPLELDYSTRVSNSHDVESVRRHRLDPSRYRIVQGKDDGRSYEELSDLDGGTGLLLQPSDSGDFKLSIFPDSRIEVTGLVIMNGDCRDSLSRASNGYAEKMLVSRLIRKNVQNKEPKWEYDYAERRWIKEWIEAEYYPATCSNDAPEDYSWDGLIFSAEKVNMEHRIWPEGSIAVVNPDYTEQIDIFIPKQDRDVYISEIILLHEEK